MVKTEILRNRQPKIETSPFQFVGAVLRDVKKHLIGNCGESAIIGQIALAANGIKSHVAKLCVYKKGKRIECVDHVFNFVSLGKNENSTNLKQDGKNSYVVDLWDGSVDYSAKAFARFESKFKHYLKPDKDGIPKTLGIEFRYYYDFDVDEEMLRMVKEKYPQLCIQNNIKAADSQCKSAA